MSRRLATCSSCDVEPGETKTVCCQVDIDLQQFIQDVGLFCILKDNRYRPRSGVTSRSDRQSIDKVGVGKSFLCDPQL